MPPPNPADALRTAPIEDLVVILLKQYKRLLADRGLDLSTPAMTRIGAATATHAPLTADATKLIDIVATLVQESITELDTRFGLTFAEALAADMNTIGGWETTSDFLEIANHKSNAELRISSGSSLLAFLSDTRHADELFITIAADASANDVDATFARRALSHAAQIAPDADNWEAQVRAALAASSDNP